MLTRRIVACACALALAVPAAAAARPGFDAPPTTQQTPHVVYGDTKYDLQNQQDLGSPKGDTKDDLVVAAGKSAGTVASLSAEQLAAAYGGNGPLHAAPVATASSDHDVNGWRIAAVAEAGLLAALALGAAVVVARMRPRGTAHA